MYYSISEDHKGSDHLEYTGILNKRIAIREDIKRELKEYFSILKESNGNKVKKSIILALSPFVKLEYAMTASLRRPTWENCETCELSNVSLYYDCLYRNSSSRNFTDLLLKQKGRIEEYLIAQM
ncbi:hypothetical protein [Autumnicola edwardsiae]|uniref:Uncharacterized protein n=1 Tax=Autumnicola edwardsiae TaxID=3075594 RepID=A0ABU3CVK1_9FLAO|nr:hypothetical protein [Zunongwangia sp. F297]MDT0650370.1 hypothetical protein [Zunongwangia sp. F297]